MNLSKDLISEFQSAVLAFTLSSSIHLSPAMILMCSEIAPKYSWSQISHLPL